MTAPQSLREALETMARQKTHKELRDEGLINEGESADFEGAYDMMIETARVALKFDEPVARYRHIKKGSTYRMVREDRVKIESDWVDAVVYESADGLWIVRAKAEFFDGRFEKIEEAK